MCDPQVNKRRLDAHVDLRHSSRIVPTAYGSNVHDSGHPSSGLGSRPASASGGKSSARLPRTLRHQAPVRVARPPASRDPSCTKPVVAVAVSQYFVWKNRIGNRSTIQAISNHGPTSVYLGGVGPDRFVFHRQIRAFLQFHGLAPSAVDTSAGVKIRNLQQDFT